MTRTINANLSAALASGSGQPYLMGFIGYADGSVLHSHPVTSYKLTGTTLEFEMPYTGDLTGNQTRMWLERGVTIAGVKYSLTTGRFCILNQSYSPGRMTARGSLFPKQYYSAAGSGTYEAVISAFCTAFGKTAVFRSAYAWRNYQFFPAGQNIIINDANSILNLLAQKYLIFACDNGNEEILFSSCDGSLAGAADVSMTAVASYTKEINSTRGRSFVWCDESENVHTAGAATDPIHNLGFLASTASAPARTSAPQVFSCTTRPNLTVIDGDIVALTSLGSTHKGFALVTEQAAAPDASHRAPRWEMVIDANPIFGNTAGGAMPSTIERVSNYTPLNTSRFDHILSANENNLQAAMDKIDDHSHAGGGAFANVIEVVYSLADAAVANPVVGTWYNPSPFMQITLTPGRWLLMWSCKLYCTGNGQQLTVQGTLSTTNNSETDNDLTGGTAQVAPAYTTKYLFLLCSRMKVVTVAVNTTYYFNILNTTAGQLSIGVNNTTEHGILRAYSI